MIRTTGRALLIQDAHVLAIKYHEDGEGYYPLPGAVKTWANPSTGILDANVARS